MFRGANKAMMQECPEVVGHNGQVIPPDGVAVLVAEYKRLGEALSRKQLSKQQRQKLEDRRADFRSYDMASLKKGTARPPGGWRKRRAGGGRKQRRRGRSRDRPEG